MKMKRGKTEYLALHIAAGLGITLAGCRAVHGGDINEAWQLTGTRCECYFLKTNDAQQYPQLFAAEADGLHALAHATLLKVPAVVDNGIWQNRQYLVLEWLEIASPAPNYWEHFGRQLAMMHKLPQNSFGWHTNNYIGSLPQINTPHKHWHGFYAACRILPLVKQLVDSGSFGQQESRAAAALCLRLEHLFPAEPPALLHGDLWSGNCMATTGGYAALYDPAVYSGHREMDIAMTRLFGGFAPAFYDAYNEAYPLASGWQERLHLAQLYPLLVHAVLFGGGYVGRCREIILACQ